VPTMTCRLLVREVGTFADMAAATYMAQWEEAAVVAKKGNGEDASAAASVRKNRCKST
jgi:hypothetical protein